MQTSKGQVLRLCGNGRLVYEQTSKGRYEDLSWEEPSQGVSIVGCPKSAGEPRAPSWVWKREVKEETR